VKRDERGVASLILASLILSYFIETRRRRDVTIYDVARATETPELPVLQMSQTTQK